MNKLTLSCLTGVSSFQWGGKAGSLLEEDTGGGRA